jgi:hypothetical protein
MQDIVENETFVVYHLSISTQRKAQTYKVKCARWVLFVDLLGDFTYYATSVITFLAFTFSLVTRLSSTREY